MVGASTQAVSARHMAIGERASMSVSARAGGGEPRHRLEERVRRAVTRLRLGQQVGQRAEGRDQQPQERDDEVALTRADALAAVGDELRVRGRRPA